jgi:hypothetical protein
MTRASGRRLPLLHPPIGVLVVRREHQVVAVAADLISLPPGWFVEKVEDERSSLHDRTVIVCAEAPRGAELGQENDQENCQSGWHEMDPFATIMAF